MSKRVIVVMAGCKYHGKDTFADLLARLIPDSRRDSYIEPLRIAVNAKTGIPMEILNGPKSLKDDPRFGRYGKSARQYLIEEGDFIRSETNIAALVDRLAERAVGAPERVTIVSDGRMPETEISGVSAALSQLGEVCVVIPILITRASEPVDLSHPTESAVYNAPRELFKYVICNDGDLDDRENVASGVADDLLAAMRE